MSSIAVVKDIVLLDTLAENLWAYWKLSVRVAYYGMRGPAAQKNFKLALERWESDDAWDTAAAIQAEISRSRRLLPLAAQTWLATTQEILINDLDSQMDSVLGAGSAADWKELYLQLRDRKRQEIDSLLDQVANDLRIGSASSRPRVT